MFAEGATVFLLRPSRELSTAISLSVCLCVGPWAYLWNHWTTEFCVQIPCGHGLVLLWRRCDTLCIAPSGLRGCKNRAHSVSWLEVVKGLPNQGLDCFVSYGSVFCFSFVFLVYVVLCLIVFGCQYQCNWLPGKTRLRNDLLCVEWDVKPYTFTHSLPNFVTFGHNRPYGDAWKAEPLT